MDEEIERVSLLGAKALVKREEADETISLLQELEENKKCNESYMNNLEQLRDDVNLCQNKLRVYKENFGELEECKCPTKRGMFGFDDCKTCEGTGYFIPKKKK